jgi:hypothetical protein
MTDLRQAAQQEPVAWMFQHDETGRMNYVSNDGMNTPKLFLKGNPRYALVCPLYATPPAAQRPWQGLTDGEIYTAYITAANQTLRPQDERIAFAFARAIEAAHGIKEGT